MHRDRIAGREKTSVGVARFAGAVVTSWQKLTSMGIPVTVCAPFELSSIDRCTVTLIQSVTRPAFDGRMASVERETSQPVVEAGDRLDLPGGFRVAFLAGSAAGAGGELPAVRVAVAG